MVAGALREIPPAHRETVHAALAAAFGAASVDRVTPLSGGISASLIARVDLGGRRCVVRIEGPRAPLRYPGQYASMRIAANAGIAPPVHHIDEANGIVVMDYVEERPLGSYPGGPETLVQDVGRLLQRLQAAPTAPAFASYPEIVTRLFGHVRRTGLFATGVLDAHAAHLERLCAAYEWDPAGSVYCHNDLYARNILFDGTRLWLIDWESAYPNDPLVDVAIVLDNLAAAPGLARLFLEARLGGVPDEALGARLAQTRALTRLYYAGVHLSASATRPRALPETDLSAPALPEFETAIREGKLQRGMPDTTLVMGKMYLRGFLTGDAVPPLAEL